jgi:hypothetical protein
MTEPDSTEQTPEQTQPEQTPEDRLAAAVVGLDEAIKKYDAAKAEQTQPEADEPAEQETGRD